jgi:hypothetical protein
MITLRPRLILDLADAPDDCPVVLELFADVGPKQLVIAHHVADLMCEGIVDGASFDAATGCWQFGTGPAPALTTFTVQPEGRHIARNDKGMPAPKALPAVAGPSAATHASGLVAAGDGSGTAAGSMMPPYTAFFDPTAPTGIWFLAGASPNVPDAVCKRAVLFGFVVQGRLALREAAVSVRSAIADARGAAARCVVSHIGRGLRCRALHRVHSCDRSELCRSGSVRVLRRAALPPRDPVLRGPSGMPPKPRP